MNVACRSHHAHLHVIVLTILGTADYEASYVGLIFCVPFVKLHARSSAFKMRDLLNECCGHGSEVPLGPEYLCAVFISVSLSGNW